MNSIEEQRAFYAKFVVSIGGSKDENLIAAFASIPREDYLGKGPWPLVAGTGYITSPSDDPRVLYQDVVVGLIADRHINNGQPSLHARCLAACAPAKGDTVVQIGTGAGYYTAILATLVGETGKVIGYEIETELATRARENLRHLPNVRIEAASATNGELPRANVIYVNAGATHPLAAWLDALHIGGRLIFPLTAKHNHGIMLLLTRQTDEHYAARTISPVAFVPCVGARDDRNSDALTKSFPGWPVMAAKSLRRQTAPDATACCVGDGWWLSTAEPA